MTNRISEVTDLLPVRNVLISTADKRGLDILVQGLLRHCPGVTFYSTGGTWTAISAMPGITAGKNLIQVSDYTGQPETQGGLVKTLDFKIYLGLLTESDNPDHAADMARTGAVAFDLAVVNLYPFTSMAAKSDATLEDARSHIDIGGPTMLRAAAKNFLRVCSVCDPDDYSSLISALNNDGCTKLKFRFELAKKLFAHISNYDGAIARFMDHGDSDQLLSCYKKI